jgi:DNA-binding GntR family transcriptional regulator
VAQLQAGTGALRLSSPDAAHGEGSLQSLTLDHSTLAARAHDAIRAAIVDGRLAAGERYSVARLAERFGVSRTPVREALLLLERQGVVRFERNRGVRVLETSVHDLEEVFTLRLLLEVPATYRACPTTISRRSSASSTRWRRSPTTATRTPSWPTTPAFTRSS